MRLFVIVFFLLCSGAGQAYAFLEHNCELYWKAYSLSQATGVAAVSEKANAAHTQMGEEAAAPSSEQSPGRRMLLALTVVPRPGEYLYGPDSPEGLPTTVKAGYAPLAAFPMQKLSGRDIAALLEEQGVSLAVHAPTAVLKKETRFASQVLPGSEDSNPPIYPGPVTFWTELPVTVSGLGGVAVQATVSGLLCSPLSCTPASGELNLFWSASELEAFPPAEQEPWWSAWNNGESVLIEPPAAVMAAVAAALPSEGPGGAPGREAGASAPGEGAGEGELARHAAFFATLEPAFFIPALEVQFFGEALIFGLLAGLLLNLMPCVLPVVSLKFSALMAVSSMTNKQEQARAFRVHCLIFALGILVWFVVLSLLLGVAGWAWGELFQQPLVIVILGLILFLLGLSLFGVFSLPILDLKVATSSHPHWQSFASGLLATLLATPCSGPLLGGVLAWAIRQPLPMLIMSISSVGIGMALPYGVMAMCPRLVHLLPRPGTWTIRLEQLLGFFLLGSVVYLVTLLPSEWVPAFLFNLFAVAFAAWLWGQIGHLRASRLRRGVSRVLAVGVVALALVWGKSSINPDTAWEAFDPQVFADVLGKEALLLDFTADWCPSCKALEHTTLNKDRMSDLRRRYNMRTIRVDLTRDAEVGKELLKALDSTSIPVLALFPKGENAKQPVVLRDLVTPKQLEEAVAATFDGSALERLKRTLSVRKENRPASGLP